MMWKLEKRTRTGSRQSGVLGAHGTAFMGILRAH